MSRVIGIYLAAGRSSRMGTDKLQLPVGGTTLGSIALLTALQSKLYHVVIVTREPGIPAWIDSRLLEKPLRARWSYAYCANADLGQGYSLRRGLLAAKIYMADAVLIMLADQPCVTTWMLNELLQRFQTDSAAYATAFHQEIPRPPTVFGKQLFGELLKLNKDEGARGLLRDNRWKGTVLTYDDPLLFFDVDTVERYTDLLQRLNPIIPAFHIQV